MATRHAGEHYSAGIGSMELRDFSSAARYLHQATTLEPARADFAAHFAKALVRIHRNHEAKAVADRALALSSSDPATLDTLGVIYTQLSDCEPAGAFRAAASLTPQSASFRCNLATSLIARGTIDDAELELAGAERRRS